MKKLMIILLLFAMQLTAQEFNKSAKYLKKNYPAIFDTTIVRQAKLKWKMDYEMILYNINNQSLALVESYSLLLDVKNGSEDEQSEYLGQFINDITKWAYADASSGMLILLDTKNIIKLSRRDNGERDMLRYFLMFKCDWEMVHRDLFKYNKIQKVLKGN